MRNSLRKVVGGGLLFVTSVLACSSRDTPEQKAAVSQENLTASEITRILSFEGTIGTSGDWVPTGGTVASSTAHASAGTHSLVMTGSSSISVQSVALSALGTVGANLSADIWLPTTLNGQSNKGNIQAFFNSNTLQLFSYSTSNIQLTSLTPGQFSRINIPLDSTLKSKLSQSGYTDLQVKLAFGLADTTNQTFVDNLSFNVSTGGSGGASGTGGSKSTGGSSGIGGTKSSGGVTNSGGTTSSGGSKASGGATATGGKSSTGGSSATGGKSSTGGSIATGGKSSTGGTIATGGKSSGGTSSSGGASASGGSLGTGGSKQTGGTTFLGGNGGTLGTGGLQGQGGIIVIQTGGTPGTGGSIATGGASPTGGSAATGGANTGGSSASGGASAGGNSPNGGSGGSFDLPWGSGPYTFSFELPPGVNRSQIVLGTTKGDLWVDDGVKLVSGTGYASVSSVDNGKVNRVGVSAEVQDVWSGGDVTLANYATVNGSLETTGVVTEQAGAAILGTESQQASMTPLQTISWTVNFPGSGLPTVSLTSTASLNPGGYPEYGVKTGGQLNLSAGTYYFPNLTLEPGSSLNIDNSQGPVYIYIHGNYTQRGTVTTVSSKANVLIGVAGTNAIPIDSSLNGILIAPDASVALSTNVAGHTGAVFAKSITAHQNTTITLKALQPSNFCSQSDACSSFCPCSAGTKPCTGDSTCALNLVCGTGNGPNFGLPATTSVCWAAYCATNPMGSLCSSSPKSCQSDSDCGSGLVCGTNNGAQFIYMASHLCWPASCVSDPVGTGCGNLQAPCGFCPSSCVPNCASKSCGDAPDDGCGGTCTGYCKNGDTGCTSSNQCIAGSVCSTIASPYYGKTTAQAACWPVQCENQNSGARDCGKAMSVCGTVCSGSATQCQNRQCGLEPRTGANCGTCNTGQFCNGSGQCQAQTTDILGSGQPSSGAGTVQAAPTDVGAIQGSFSVTPMGKAHYSMPLFVSPGVNALTPTMSFEYESTTRDGELGVGWSLSGPSTIERCPKDHRFEGPKPIVYDNSDRYCLDGTPLYRVTQGSDDGAEYRIQFNSLIRVFVHMSTSGNYVGPDHFDLYSPDGRLSRYGGADAGANGRFGDGMKETGVYNSWALSKVTDTSGNVITYSYAPNTYSTYTGVNEAALPGQTDWFYPFLEGSQPELVQISYGGSETVGANRIISIEREALFARDSTKYQQRFAWHAGAPYKQVARISSITMTYEGQEVRKYFLAYEEDTRRSKLSKVYECAQGRCKQPTVFSYKAPAELLMPHNVAGSGGSKLLGGLSIKTIAAVFDADGDGLADLILNPNLDPQTTINCDNKLKFAHATIGPDNSPSFSISDIPGTFNSCASITAGDLDNDGKDELFLRSGPIMTDLGIPGNGFYKLVFNPTTSNLSSVGLVSTATDPPLAADYNGDGLFETKQHPSLFDIDTDDDGVPNPISPIPGGSELGVPSGQACLIDATKCDAAIDLGVQAPTISTLPSVQDASLRSRMGVGWICPPSNGCICTGSGSKLQTCADNCWKGWDPNTFCLGTRVFHLQDWTTGTKILDVNGDGLKDILRWTMVSYTGNLIPTPSLMLELYLNTGRNHFLPVDVDSTLSSSDAQVLNSFLNAGVFRQSFVYDVDQNGTQDLVLIDTATKNVYALMAQPNQGYFSTFHVKLLNPGSASNFVEWFTDEGDVFVMDFNADGVPDTLFGDGGNLQLQLQSGGDHDLLDTVSDGNGRIDSVSYVSGRALGHYSTTSMHNEVGVQSRPAQSLRPTVTSHQISASDSFGASKSPTITETYSYVDGRVGFGGGGFLGFYEIDKSLSTSDIGSVSDSMAYYHPDTNDEYEAGLGTGIYYEVGRPWKEVTVTHKVPTGVQRKTSVVDRVTTRTRTLKRMSSDMGTVRIAVPDEDTSVTYDVDSQGHQTRLWSSSTTYGFDQYGQRTSEYYEKQGPSLLGVESRKSTITYERDQGFTDKWLLALPKSTKVITSNDGDTVTRETEYEHYSNGKVHFVHQEPNDKSLAIDSEFIYNGRGNVTSVIQTDAAVSYESDNYYDSTGEWVQATINPLMQSTAYAYFRGYGQLAETQDPNGLIASRQIDPFGREIQTTNANAVNVTTSYEKPGGEAYFLTTTGRDVAYATRITSDGQPTQFTFYDHFGRAIGTYALDLDDVAVHTQTFYDSLGRKVARSHRPIPNTIAPDVLDHLYYDNLNRPTSLVVANDATSNKTATYSTSYGYPVELGADLPADRQLVALSATMVTNPNGSTKISLLDAENRSVAAMDPFGVYTTSAYSAAGKIRLFTDAANQKTEYHYDVYGRQTYASDSLRGETTTIGTPLGSLVETSTPTGEVDTKYDALGRPTFETSPEGSTTWTYDSEPGALGKLAEVVGPATKSSLGHKVHYTYGSATDSPGERGLIKTVQSTIAGETFAVDYQRDNLGRLQKTTYPAINGYRYAVKQEYSTGGRISKVTEADGINQRTLWQLTGLDEIGRLKSERQLDAVYTEYTYSDIDGLITELTTREASAERMRLDYTYDVEHNVLGAIRRENGQFSDQSRIYAYDRSGRITDEFSAVDSTTGAIAGDLKDHVAYASNGNIVSRTAVGTYKYGQLGNPYAVTEAGGNSFQYDAWGRQSSRSGSSVPGGQMYINWNSFDSPSSITYADKSTTQFEYNGLKERVLEDGPTTRKIRVGGIYQRTEDLLTGARTHSLTVSAGNKTVAEVEFTESAGSVSGPDASAIISDKLESASLVRDHNGQYTFRSYDAFGKPSGAAALPSGVSFAGYLQDDSTGLLWMNNRLYDPNIGRVLAADPIINAAMGPDGANRYAYVYNHPTAFIDPSGFEGEEGGGDDGGDWVPTVDWGSLEDPFAPVGVSYSLRIGDPSGPSYTGGDNAYSEGDSYGSNVGNQVNSDAYHPDGFNIGDNSKPKFELAALRWQADPASTSNGGASKAQSSVWASFLIAMAETGPVGGTVVLVAELGAAIGEGLVLAEEEAPRVEAAVQEVIASEEAAAPSQLQALQNAAQSFLNAGSRFASYIGEQFARIGAAEGGGVAADANQFQAYRAELAQLEIEGADAVGSALKSDPFHRAASFVTGDIASSGKVFTIPGFSGPANLTQILGELNGIGGRFEWIVDSQGNLTHQMFVPGGVITGIPIVAW